MNMILIAGAAILVYHHLLYPVLLRYAVVRRRRVHSSVVGSVGELPTIVLIVPARDEAAVIADKIANIVSLHYPAQRLTLILALDGCCDQTEAIARRTLADLDPPFAWEIVVTSRSCGKVAVLNREIGRAGADLVVLSDASSLVDDGALLKAAAHFARADVGVVCGTYRLLTSSGIGESAYWRHQTALKADEATFAAPMGAHGAFYVFRRPLWSLLPSDVVNDDFVLPMRIVEQGYEAIYDQTIVATEIEASASAQDFWRRVRLGAGNLQQAVMLIGLANPRRPRLAFVFLSGKGLRAVTPLILLAMAAAAIVSASQVVGLGAELLAAPCFAIAVAGSSRVEAARVPNSLRIFAYVTRSYAAMALGALLWITGRQSGAWTLSLRAKGKADATRTPGGTVAGESPIVR